MDDFERAIEDGVNVYKAMTRDLRFVPGGGATEIELAKRIQSYGESTPGVVQYAIKKYGESMEIIPRTLAENSGHDAIKVLSELYAAHQNKENGIHMGLDVESGETINTTKANILDLLSCKAQALKLATHAAITILRVDQLIMAKTAGGPKPPKMGQRDDD